MDINEENFPDANFRAYVETLPGAQDGVFTKAELDAVTEIQVEGIGKSDEEKLESLQRIEYFANLSVIRCSGNRLRKSMKNNIIPEE